jgi:predicted phosphodiesterase
MMGVHFAVEHVNFISYLVSEEKRTAPRASRSLLHEFFTRLSEGYRADGQGYAGFENAGLRLGGRRESVISSDPNWLNRLQRVAAKQAWWTSDRYSIFPEKVSSQTAARLLTPLREFFTGYALCGLVIPDQDSQLAANFFEDAAISSGSNGLFLMPDRVDRTVNVLDPFPPLRALAETPVQAPVVAFWTPMGGACALPLVNAEEFYEKTLRPLLGEGVIELDRAIRTRATDIATGRIIHLSDLHFGDTRSDLPRQYIKAHLTNIVKNNDRVVVTGDLMNTPNKDLFDRYADFRNEVERLTSDHLIAIPGNHDVRPTGNKIPVIGQTTYELVTDIGWSPIVVDNNLGCVFLGFNSLEEGDFARGFVSDDQLYRVGIRYEQEISRQQAKGNHEFPAYFKIALVHHHPYTYVTKPSAFYDKLIRLIFRDEDKFLRFDNADRFVNWCAERDVSLILHGHKHVPHHITAKVNVPNRSHEIMVVSCGSTMGAEKSALCYDVISLNKDTKRWNVIFYHDPSRSGASFREQEIEIDLRL